MPGAVKCLTMRLPCLPSRSAGGQRPGVETQERAVVWFYLFPPQEKLRGVNAMHRIQPRLQSQKDLMFETVSTVPF